MSVAFRIAVPAELAKHLLKNPEISPIASATEVSAQEEGRLNFDLQTVAAVITIAVGLVELTTHAVKLAAALKDWQKLTGTDTKVVLQGPTQDRIITVKASLTVEVLAREIELVARD